MHLVSLNSNELLRQVESLRNSRDNLKLAIRIGARTLLQLSKKGKGVVQYAKHIKGCNSAKQKG